MIQTDIIIIGAGPCGLFTVFEAGLLKLRCHLIDALPQAGGQCSEIYPKKPIYDIPAYPEVLAGDLIDKLMEQIAPFKPGFTLGERAEFIEKDAEGQFIVKTSHGTVHRAPVITIAGGLGCFEPRKPPVEGLADFEGHGVEYIIKDPDIYKGKRVVISGGGDSALDWALYLANGVAEEVTLVHRRDSFRAHPDSVQKVLDLAAAGGMRLMTHAEVVGVNGGSDGALAELTIKHKKEGASQLEVDHWIPLFGLSPKLGPIGAWNLNISKNAVEVDTFDYQTNVPGIYAIGDINTYPGKLKLILCGFHEATLMVQSAFKRIHPDKNNVLKYTTVNGVNAF
jgi:thioredoxin reductase (NADPH)